MSPLALRAMCTSVAGRYAWALFEAARERQALEETGNDCELAATLLSPHSPFRLTIVRALQGRYPEAWTRQLIGLLDFQAFFLSFLKLLTDKNRLSALKDITRLYKRLVDAELNRVALQVISADPLEEKQRQALEQHLHKLFQKEMMTSYLEDPRILGGVVVLSDTVTIDASVRHHIDAFISQARKGFEEIQPGRNL